MSKLFAVFLPIFAIIITTISVVILNGKSSKVMDRKAMLIFLVLGILMLLLILGAYVMLYR